MKVDKNTLTHMAHFVPCSKDISKQGKNDLIIGALYYESRGVNINEIEKCIDERFGVTVSLSDVEETITKLLQEDIVLKINNKYLLHPNVVNDIKDRLKNENELSEKVLKQWIEEDIEPNYPELTESQMSVLEINLVSFLKSLFVRHGVECLDLIMGDVDGPTGSFDLKSIINNLPLTEPECPELREIQLVEFPKFFSYENEERKLYLIRLIDKAFLFLTTVCDPKVLEGFKEKLKNKVVYLDSNVIYRFVNLQGAKRHKSITEVVEICRKYNLELCVSK